MIANDHSAGEIDCYQDGKSFFTSYKQHIPSSDSKCFAVNKVDFFATKGGTRNVRLSNAGCTDVDTKDDFEEL